jgi:hypothetical protein
MVSEKPGIYVCGEYGNVPGIQWACFPDARLLKR